jgi:hypothetical protein
MLKFLCWRFILNNFQIFKLTLQRNNFQIFKFSNYCYSVIYIFLSACFITGNAQPENSFFFPGAQVHYGFIIPHTAAVEPVSHSNPAGFELDFNWLNTSYESWKVFRRYNISGIQAAYINFRNPEVGSAYMLSTYTEPILRSGERFIFSVKAGGGISWQTKIFDYTDDTISKFFSTRISFPLYISARLRYRLTSGTMLTLSGCYNHISNGAIRNPNYGINFPTVSLGLEYFPGKFPAPDHSFKSDGDTRSSHQYILFQGITGFKSLYGESFLSVGFSARYTRHLRTWYALNGGAELIMDKGVRKMIEVDDRKDDYKRFAITAGQDFYLGRIVFSQYLGIYLYSPYKAKDPVYQKYELAYRILPDFLLGAYLKAHTSDAELFGFSANYILRLR